ncbi:flavin reductase family protein [Microbulbifer pacificus]|uniref:Flavin reductase family protein n=1 Tax=Microbulbifer pacificus TaxID=407164 RepID=A0AAU0N234_9GAMM|nr:flavin reductase family protein [Microbulbifer pacificus]WOX07017.1 flavin reductase family protein [Microbulbifer pacificus]
MEIEINKSVGSLFRTALRGLASGVVIISSRNAEGRFAMSATSITSLSMDPPSLLVCVNKQASIYQSLQPGNDFAISILSKQDQMLAEMCGGKAQGEARFASSRWLDDSGLPILSGAQATIRCKIEERLSYGTHGVFIGSVKSCEVSDTIDPLVYLDGRYVGIDSMSTCSEV